MPRCGASSADALVRVFNRRGACLLFAEVTEDVPPGLLVAEGIWWSKHHPDGKGVNQLASQRVTDLGACSTLHENLVNVEPAQCVSPQGAPDLFERLQSVAAPQPDRLALKNKERRDTAG